MKGLAGLVFESLTAAGQAGSADWMRAEMATELGPDGAALIDRLVTGTQQHAARRTHEMNDVLDYLHALGTPDWMTEGTVRWLEHIAEQGDPRA
jgi:hypothetical protein